jgi:ribosome-interacting GTPase 1
VGMINYPTGVQVQLIEIPAFESEYYDKGLTNTADAVLIMVNNLEQIKEIKKELEKTRGKQVVVFNKTDLFNEQEKRKTIATLQSKKHDFVLISTKTREGIEELKNKIFQKVGKMRIYTKEPRKKRTERPIIMKEESTVKDVAEKILTGFSQRIKETKIWGPSSKFSGQVVGLKHKLKDLDVVEFKTR